MILSMTLQITPAFFKSCILKSEFTTIGRRYIRSIKIDQITVIGSIALQTTHAMRIMAGIAGCFYIINMLLMVREGLISIDRCTAVTAVAQSKVIGVVRRIISS